MIIGIVEHKSEWYKSGDEIPGYTEGGDKPWLYNKEINLPEQTIFSNKESKDAVIFIGLGLAAILAYTSLIATAQGR